MPDSSSDHPAANPPDPVPQSPDEGEGIVNLKPIPSASDEAPDRDTQAWEGSQPEDSVGLVDPRHEIPNPPGL